MTRWAAIGVCAMGVAFGQAAAPVPLPAQLGLPQAEQMLLERSLAVAASRGQLEAAQALRQIVGYKPNPSLQLGAEQFPVHSNMPGTVPRFFTSNLDAATEPTYTAQFIRLDERGGKREARVAQTEAQIDAAKAQILDSFRTQLWQLRQAFAAALLARENLKLAEAMDQEYQQTEDLTSIRVKAGDLAEMEMYRVRTGRLPFKQAILEARTSYQQALRDVANLLNASAGNAEITGDFSSRPVRQSLEDLVKTALDQRPDVTVARNNSRASDAGVRLAQAQRARDISVTFEYQQVGNDSALGVITQIPLFMYNNQKAGVAQAVSLQHVAEAQLHAAESQARTDVEKAYQAYQTAQAALELYGAENLGQVQKLKDAVAYSFKRGEASLFELLDAERSARQATIAYNQARASYQLSLWQLEAAIGQPLE